MEREFSPEERARLAAAGHAMPDGSYPLPDCDAVRRAVQAYGREAVAKRPALRRLIVRRAVALGCTQHIPADWKVEGR